MAQTPLHLGAALGDAAGGVREVIRRFSFATYLALGPVSVGYHPDSNGCRVWVLAVGEWYCAVGRYTDNGEWFFWRPERRP